MTWILSALKAVGSFFAWLWNLYWNRLTLKAKIVLWAFIIAAAVGGYIIYLRYVRSELEQDLRDANVNSILRDDQRLANEEEKAKENANKIAENTNALTTQRNAARDLDSSKRSGAQIDADNKYCPKHCTDSSCQEWRRTHTCS